MRMLQHVTIICKYVHECVGCQINNHRKIVTHHWWFMMLKTSSGIYLYKKPVTFYFAKMFFIIVYQNSRSVSYHLIQKKTITFFTVYKKQQNFRYNLHVYNKWDHNAITLYVSRHVLVATCAPRHRSKTAGRPHPHPVLIVWFALSIATLLGGRNAVTAELQMFWGLLQDSHPETATNSYCLDALCVYCHACGLLRWFPLSEYRITTAWVSRSELTYAHSGSHVMHIQSCELSHLPFNSSTRPN